MSRSARFRGYAIAAVVVAALVSVLFIADQTWFLFALLIAIASYVRFDDDASSAGFEAAVIFAAVPLLHTPAIALFAIFTLRRFSLRSLVDAVQLTLSYAVVAMLYCSAVAADAP